MSNRRASGNGRRKGAALAAALLLTAAACGGGDETSSASDLPGTSTGDTSETTTTTSEAPPETVVETAQDRVENTIGTSTYSQQVLIEGQDDQGYTFTAGAAFALGNGQVDISSTPPGKAQYRWDIAFDITITNTTSGRQLPLEGVSLLVWLPDTVKALDASDVRYSAPFAPTVIEADGQISYETGLVPDSEHVAVSEDEANHIVGLINTGEVEAFEVFFETTDLHAVSYVFDPQGQLVKTCAGEPFDGFVNCWRDE